MITWLPARDAVVSTCTMYRHTCTYMYMYVHKNISKPQLPRLQIAYMYVHKNISKPQLPRLQIAFRPTCMYIDVNPPPNPCRMPTCTCTMYVHMYIRTCMYTYLHDNSNSETQERHHNIHANPKAVFCKRNSKSCRRWEFKPHHIMHTMYVRMCGTHF